MNRLFSKFAEGGWNIAVRTAASGTILTDQTAPFQLVPNSWRSWAADPFIFDYDGTVYIFAELFDYIKRRGRIGYTCLKNGKWQRWKIVIDEPFHMSYPNIFIQDNTVYMIPETSADRTLRLYKAVQFPDKWELDRVIARDVAFVDTTFYRHDGKLCAITTDIADEPLHRDFVLTFDDRLELLSKEEIQETQLPLSRCGGNFFMYGADTIRVSQNCDGHYGNALIFSKFHPGNLLSQGLGEILQQFAPQDLRFSAKHHWTGLHTYNSIEHYEVVDIERNHYTPVGLLGRIFYKIKH